jgi:cyclase
MLRTRIIPVLLLRDESIVKTVNFKKFTYIGDPCNTVRIFNELEVDELLLLDITATKEKRGPSLSLLADIATECFMPLSYGGGIRSLADAKAVFEVGVEKVSINSEAIMRPEVIGEIARNYGSQSVIVSIDVKKTFLGGTSVFSHSVNKSIRLNPVSWAREVEQRGAGEILLTSVDLEGSWSGFDLNLVKRISDAVSIPVIAHGGAGRISDIEAVINQSKASAVGLGSMVVFQKKGMGVLVNFPDDLEINNVL